MKKVTILNNEAEKLAFVEKMATATIDKPVQIETSLYKPKRSNSINALMWIWYGEIQKHLKDHFGQIYSTDDIHEYMILKLLPKKAVEIDGDMKIIRAHTSKMNNKEMVVYLETLEHYCGSDLGLRLTHPDEYREAMK